MAAWMKAPSTISEIYARPPRSVSAIIGASLVCLILGFFVQGPAAFARDQANVPAEDPDKRCAACHADVYRQYQKSSMARGSGTALQGFIPGQYAHAASGVDFRVFLRDGSARMSYHRGATAQRAALDGERTLEYFIGSGAKGRTFLYEQEGYWYELPINYYTRKAGWEMAPNYSGATSMPAPLPTDPNCLHCHATSISKPQPNAANDFGAVPFAQGGIGCNACHGDPAKHLATGGRGPIINPTKLAPAARDSTCLQCHLEGNAVVYRPNRTLAGFKAGDDLRDTALYFVYASQAMGGSRATSQYEALLQSACKRASSDNLTCTTCHDPHGDPPAAERVNYFRARCLSCHTDPVLATKHHPEQPDCATCHMPSRDTSDISHEQVTDHNIQRYPAVQTTAKPQPGEDLVAVGALKVDDRELGLAYSQLAQRGDRKAGERALSLLVKAEKSMEDDEQVHLNLGFLQQISGNSVAARTEYETVLKQNKFEASALTNLAVLDARTGDLGHAMTLLHQAIDADPARTAAGLNLAFLECRLGHVAEARRIASRLREFNPDSPELLIFTRTGSYGGQSCAAMLTGEVTPAPMLRSLH